MSSSRLYPKAHAAAGSVSQQTHETWNVCCFGNARAVSNVDMSESESTLERFSRKIRALVIVSGL
jgi:hypothetical protein